MARDDPAVIPVPSGGASFARDDQAAIAGPSKRPIHSTSSFGADKPPSKRRRTELASDEHLPDTPLLPKNPKWSIIENAGRKGSLK